MCKRNKQARLAADKAAHRLVMVNGSLRKVSLESAHCAFDAAMRVRKGRKQDLDRELLIHGVT